MKRHTLLTSILIFISISMYSQDIQLPEPQKEEGMPLMEALNRRQSTREYADKELSMQQLSNLLWAAWGVNRENKRTAPSCMNKQEIILYITLKSGVYFYSAKSNMLIQVSDKDVRAATGTQDFVSKVALNIIMVADETKGGCYSELNAGTIVQNVYLYCASEGLGAVVRASFDAETVIKALKLKDTEKPIITQSVGVKK